MGCAFSGSRGDALPPRREGRAFACVPPPTHLCGLPLPSLGPVRSVPVSESVSFQGNKRWSSPLDWVGAFFHLHVSVHFGKLRVCFTPGEILHSFRDSVDLPECSDFLTWSIHPADVLRRPTRALVVRRVLAPRGQGGRGVARGLRSLRAPALWAGRPHPSAVAWVREAAGPSSSDLLPVGPGPRRSGRPVAASRLLPASAAPHTRSGVRPRRCRCSPLRLPT